MVAEMTFITVSNVTESWESIRRIPNYDGVAGVMLFRKFFELDPSAQVVFAFGTGDTKLTEEFYKSGRLMQHAKHFINMLDRSLSLLGPDIELLTDVLLELGKAHRRYGVKTSHFPAMGQALISVVEELLGDEFTPQIKDAWVEIYQALSYDMIRAQRE